jgi:hypothetical protein
MVTKKELIGNEIMKEVITIRVDTLWRMLELKQEGRLPGVNEEGATGVFDNKGAIFVPGGLICEDVDENPISYEPHGALSSASFRNTIRSAMKHDNATLLFHDGMAESIYLDSGFFAKAAREIFTYKKAAMKRKKKFGEKLPFEISSEDIARSHCPRYISEPYGARTRLSSCLAAGLMDPAMYYAYCKTALRMSEEQKEELSKSLNAVQEPIIGKDDTLIFPPYVIVCHNTRYSDESLTGITRILGIGKFGEFATFTLEEASKGLRREMKIKKEVFGPNEIFAEYEGIKVVGVLRIYFSTTPGKRSPRATTKLVSPSKDLDLDVGRIEKEARQRYDIKP